MSEELKLLPCPFCGGTNLRVCTGEYVHCPDCGTDGPFFICMKGDEDHTAEAIAAWNRRTPSDSNGGEA